MINLKQMLVVGAMSVALMATPVMLMEHNKPKPVEVAKVIPLSVPKKPIQVKPKTTKEPTWCIQVKDAVTKYGKDLVEQGAVARSMTKAQIQNVYKQCHIKD